jgi:iron(III) transport system substrate-binding protein
VAASTNAVQRPGSLLELTNAVWRGRIALAYPLFGSTATHLLALRQHWGTNTWENWCRALAANKPFLVEGNSASARAVADGRAEIALTDSDDIVAVNRDGVRLSVLSITSETLLLPNTVAVIRGAPHPEAAQRLFDYLQTPAVVQRLVEAGALEESSSTNAAAQTLQPDWEALLRDLDTGTRELQRLFVR